jgi:putative aminopeptidase FrvX
LDKIQKLLFELSAISAPSGMEGRIADRIEKALRNYTDKIEPDPLGNIHAFMGTDESKKTLLLDAHMDEIGLLITHIEDGGFLRFAPIGGIDGRTLPGTRVRVCGRENLLGVICVKAPHVQKEDELKKAMDIADMMIDIGLNKEQAEKAVSLGDTATLASEPFEMISGRISGKAFDDRAGVCALIWALDMLKCEKLDINIEILISTQEEVGLRGATAGGYRSNADFAIAVDVSHASTPDTPKNKGFKLGGGTMIGVGPNMARDISDRMIDLCKKNEIPYQLEVMGGDTGTDAWALQVLRGGIPCGLLSIPLRYMHTGFEVIDMSDVESTARLMCEFIKACKEV